MQTVTIQQAFDLALQHLGAGRLAEAEAIYRQILAQEPNHAGSLHNLGVIANQTGRSYGWVHRILVEGGVVLRARGGPRRRRHT